MKIFKKLLFILMLLIFLFSAYKLTTFYFEDSQSTILVEELTKDVITEVEIKKDLEIEKEYSPITVDFEELKNTNPDIVAWIYQPETKINYPIVQGKSNQEYLRKLLNGKYNVNGTLFLDYQNSKDFSDFYSIVYGHNMKNKTMFGSLTGYKNQEYFDKNPYMYLLTPEQDYKIKLFMGLVTKATTDNIVFNSKLTEENILEIINLVPKSTFKTNFIPTANSRIIALSTCSYEYNSARYVVFGVLEEIEKAPLN
jgi:sortase B